MTAAKKGFLFSPLGPGSSAGVGVGVAVRELRVAKKS